ncbi:MAG: hypothetical protein JW900_15550 [Anaerolineae bacterium]|nr:hypothetical protein [Anaerolineae bacterium]
MTGQNQRVVLVAVAAGLVVLLGAVAVGLTVSPGLDSKQADFPPLPGESSIGGDALPFIVLAIAVLIPVGVLILFLLFRFYQQSQSGVIGRAPATTYEPLSPTGTGYQPASQRWLIAAILSGTLVTLGVAAFLWLSLSSGDQQVTLSPTPEAEGTGSTAIVVAIAIGVTVLSDFFLLALILRRRRNSQAGRSVSPVPSYEEAPVGQSTRLLLIMVGALSALFIAGLVTWLLLLGR